MPAKWEVFEGRHVDCSAPLPFVVPDAMVFFGAGINGAAALVVEIGIAANIVHPADADDVGRLSFFHVHRGFLINPFHCLIYFGRYTTLLRFFSRY